MLTPSFSVLLSVYKKEQVSFLEQSLNSVFTQSLQPNEVVLVEDGPLTDDLVAVVDKYVTLYPIMKIIKLPQNRGLSNALNIGLTHCSHELVARMDTDDICDKFRFEKQVAFMQQKPQIDIVGTYAYRMNESGELSFLMKVPIEHASILHYIWTCPFIHPSVMFRKNKILSVGGYNPNSGPRQDDYELWFRCAMKGLCFANIPEALLYYRFNDDNIKRNNIKVGWWRFKTGFQGCKKLKCSYMGYIGITIPFLRALLPYPLNVYMYNLLNKINPRNR